MTVFLIAFLYLFKQFYKEISLMVRGYVYTISYYYKLPEFTEITSFQLIYHYKIIKSKILLRP